MNDSYDRGARRIYIKCSNEFKVFIVEDYIKCYYEREEIC